jgi:drug/metabolite transporter (DMT)-like permease
MSCALCCFTFIAVAGREAQRRGVVTIELVFLRSVLALAVLFPILIAAGRLREALSTGQPMLQLVRGGVHWVAQFSWLYALALIPLAQLFALELTAPLWVAVLAPVLIGERLTGARLLAAALGFGGALIVANPGGASFDKGALFACISALGFALSMIATKRLTRTDGAATILLYMTAVHAIISVLPAIPYLRLHDAATFGFVAAVAVFGLGAHYAMARAFSEADAIIVAPMDFMRLPLIAAVGVLLYNEPLNPWVLAGGGVVVLANLLNMWAERRRSPTL